MATRSCWKESLTFRRSDVCAGVEFDLTNLCSGTFQVRDKPGRIERIFKLLQDCLIASKFSAHDVAVLNGLLTFAGRFFMGSAVKFPTHMLSNIDKWQHNRRKAETFVRST